MPARTRHWTPYAAGVAGAGLALYLLLPHLGPLVLGLLLAVLMDRPVTALERRGFRRGVAAFLVLAAGVAAAGGTAVWLGAALYAEVRELATALPPGPVPGGALPAGAAGPWLEPLPSVLQELFQRALESAYRAAGQWVEGVIRTAARLPSLIWPLTVTVLVGYFASRDRPLLTAATLGYAPPELRHRAARFRSRLLLQVAAFLHAQVLVVTLSALLSGVALFLLGSPYALSLGLLAGILDLIPFLGPTAVFGVLAAARLLQGVPQEALTAGLAGLGVFGARQLVETRLVAGRTQLHPLTVVATVYLGSRLLGATGFLMGPVIALAVKSLLAETGWWNLFNRNLR